VEKLMAPTLADGRKKSRRRFLKQVPVSLAGAALLSGRGVGTGSFASQEVAPTAGFEYLSDLPNRFLFVTQWWGTLGLDQSMKRTGKQPSPLRIKDETFTKGLGHTAGEIVLDLNGEYTSFETKIGSQWQPGSSASLIFQVYVDGDKRFE